MQKIKYKMCYCDHSPNGMVLKSIDEIRNIKIDELYKKVSLLMDKNLEKYSSGERETWSKMNDECLEYKKSGTIGFLMSKKISSSPIYNTADKLADMTIREYEFFVDAKYHIEAQRDQHKMIIDNITNIDDLMDYDITL